MSLREFTTAMVIVLVVASGAAGSAAAFRPGGCYSSSEDNDFMSPEPYIVEGNYVDGLLHINPAKDVFSRALAEDRFLTFPVITDAGLKYPLPYSQPVFVVIVGEVSDFSIVVVSDSGKLKERYFFQSVEPGVYRFQLNGLVHPSEEAVVTLEFNGSLVARKFISTVDLSGLP